MAFAAVIPKADPILLPRSSILPKKKAIVNAAPRARFQRARPNVSIAAKAGANSSAKAVVPESPSQELEKPQLKTYSTEKASEPEVIPEETTNIVENVSESSNTTSQTVDTPELARPAVEDVPPSLPPPPPVEKTNKYPSLTSILNAPKKRAVSKEVAERKRRCSNFVDPPPRNEMTMVDLIYWNPNTSPMKAKKPATEEELVIDSPDDPVESNTPETDQAEDDNSYSSAPKVTINENGEIIIDESSLVVRRKNTIDTSIEAVVETDETTYSSFRRKCSKQWTTKETKRFYKALSLVGTDFALMEKIVPNRSRRELKTKFKREEKQNEELVHKAMYDSQTFDISVLDDDETDEVEDSPPKPVKKTKREKNSMKNKSSEESAKKKRTNSRQDVFLNEGREGNNDSNIINGIPRNDIAVPAIVETFSEFVRMNAEMNMKKKRILEDDTSDGPDNFEEGVSRYGRKRKIRKFVEDESDEYEEITVNCIQVQNDMEEACPDPPPENISSENNVEESQRNETGNHISMSESEVANALNDISLLPENENGQHVDKVSEIQSEDLVKSHSEKSPNYITIKPESENVQCVDKISKLKSLSFVESPSEKSLGDAIISTENGSVRQTDVVSKFQSEDLIKSPSEKSLKEAVILTEQENMQHVGGVSEIRSEDLLKPSSEKSLNGTIILEENYSMQHVDKISATQYEISTKSLLKKSDDNSSTREIVQSKQMIGFEPSTISKQSPKQEASKTAMPKQRLRKKLKIEPKFRKLDRAESNSLLVQKQKLDNLSSQSHNSHVETPASVVSPPNLTNLHSDVITLDATQNSLILNDTDIPLAYETVIEGTQLTNRIAQNLLTLREKRKRHQKETTPFPSKRVILKHRTSNIPKEQYHPSFSDFTPVEEKGPIESESYSRPIVTTPVTPRNMVSSIDVPSITPDYAQNHNVLMETSLNRSSNQTITIPMTPVRDDNWDPDVEVIFAQSANNDNTVHMFIKKEIVDDTFQHVGSPLTYNPIPESIR